MESACPSVSAFCTRGKRRSVGQCCSGSAGQAVSGQPPQWKRALPQSAWSLPLPSPPSPTTRSAYEAPVTSAGELPGGVGGPQHRRLHLLGAVGHHAELHAAARGLDVVHAHLGGEGACTSRPGSSGPSPGRGCRAPWRTPLPRSSAGCRRPSPSRRWRDRARRAPSRSRPTSSRCHWPRHRWWAVAEGCVRRSRRRASARTRPPCTRPANRACTSGTWRPRAA